MKKVLQKLVLFSLFAVSSGASYATTYYFSSTSGNDARSSMEARNPATPWRSIEKLNTFFKDLNPGDSVMFKRGEVFTGAIKATRSGGVFAPIYFGAYGKGARPEITTLTKLTNWKAVGNGIYEAPCTAGGDMLIMNGKQQALGRYPNKGYLTVRSHSGNNSITDQELRNTAPWTSGELAIRKNRWIIDRNKILSQTGGTINYEAGSTTYEPTNGYGYFIQNNPKTLDLLGEWYMDAARNTMMVYFGNKTPGNYNITTNTADNLVDVQRCNYLTFDNIKFSGAGKNAFNLVQSKKITINDCHIDMTGAVAVLANYSPLLTVTNTTISNSLSGGINLDAGCANAMISGNSISNTGLIAGMGKSNSGTYEAITSFGDNTKIERNKIDSVGYNGIYFGGNTSSAKNNCISYFCLTKDDGAGIYIGDWSKTVNKKVTSNIVLHGIGNSEGALYTNSLQAEGIYIDDNSESVTITNNTVSKCANNGIKVHNAKNINIFNNIVFDNGVQLRMEQDHYIPTSSYIRNNNVRNNTFFSSSERQPVAKFSTHLDDIDAFGHIDSNFYNKGNNDASSIKASRVKNGKNVNSNYSLSSWKATSGKDHSSVATTSDDVLFEYNASGKAKTLVLKQPYVDVHQKRYVNKIIIDSYSSVLLIAANNPSSIKHSSAITASLR
ncbi:right-handed parallel beta-helix repeat-containing protein [Mucilaginibacter daejeonensis]|uniref:right-handed parallel beta-helix repeat-containing protein n=1 Tax=Mucilaginibacter daejeonensis TaxID=398049 RepID=UPI001D17A478|nr:right-handed parallel beta-helix repeat-containing protein [Mucilaginibacter daejeonensis]UEG52169.1 right-handed parallel beta-helix repeat-containing protein [Mucilaginibacter daejeonensis]